MPRRIRARANSAPDDGRRRVRGAQRMAIAAGLVAVLVASLVSVAVAGVFNPVGRTADTAGARHAALGRAPASDHAAPRRAPIRAAVVAAAHSHSRLRVRHAAHTKAVAGRTSCTTVGHIGDSTSVGMVSPQWLPDAAQRLPAQYARVGVKHAWVDASGGRSIVEEMPGQINGYKVAQQWNAAGFKGCWVFALGTNDTANVFAGSSVSRMARIREMMSAAHGRPVMWVNTQTELSAGPWAQANMQAWNADLARACAAFPNMRVFNWAGQVQPSWHLPDGIHYTSAGYAIRAKAIAQALAKAFPLAGHSTGCVVN